MSGRFTEGVGHINLAGAGLNGLMSAQDKAAHDLLIDPPSARLVRTATQSIASGVNTAISWSSASGYNTGGKSGGANPWASSPNPTRFTVPAGGGGKYHFTFWAGFDTVGGGRKFAFLQLNGTSTLEVAESGSVTSTGTSFPNLPGSTEVLLVAGDYVELVVFQNSGGAVNILANSAVLTGHWESS